MESALAALGVVIGGVLKALFQKYVLGWLRSKPENKVARLLLYRIGSRTATHSTTSKS